MSASDGKLTPRAHERASSPQTPFSPPLGESGIGLITPARDATFGRVGYLSTTSKMRMDAPSSAYKTPSSKTSEIAAVAAMESPMSSPPLESPSTPLANGIGLITPGGGRTGDQAKFLSTAQKMRLEAPPTSHSALSTDGPEPPSNATLPLQEKSPQQLPTLESPGGVQSTPNSPVPRNPFAKVHLGIHICT